MSRLSSPAGAAARRDPASTAGLVYGGIMLTVSGVLNILYGVAAIDKDAVFSEVHQYAYELDLTGWGTIYLVLGALSVILGPAVGFTTARWARVAGITLASLSVFGHFLGVVYQPVWSLALIAVAFLIIWALATYDEYAAYRADR